MKRFLVLIAIAVFSGCVTAGKFSAQQSEALAQRKRADALAAELAATKKDMEAIKATEASAAVQLASAQKSNKDLQETLDAKKGELAKKVADLIKDRDALSQKLNDSEAAKTALEDAKAAELALVKKNYEDLTSGLKSEIAAGEIRITQLKGKLTVNMVDRILFDSGQSEVKTDGKRVLEKVGSLLDGVLDKDIRIEGHTDNKPIAASLQSKYPTNWELSTARATAVSRYLQDHAKLDPKRLVAAGYGEFRPVSSNDTLEGRALNRRIEIILVPKD